MSYVIFALKWRPNNFDEIVGQNHISARLKSAIQNKRLAHAYLFVGPRGVGKTSTARILAKSLNCKDGPTVNPCGKCSSCIEISSSRSFDVIEIDGASNRGIDEIRTLRENVKFSPTNGKFKIYIIDEVHMLTQEAFNALLKTLEEPPEFVKFIFATTQVHKVIPTIISRCQRFDFRRIPVVEIISQLEKIIATENIIVDKEVLFAIAKSSDGSLRDAESILDQLVSFCKEKVSLKDVISILGLVEQDILFEITDKIIQKDAKGALEVFNKIVDEGKDIGMFLTNFIEHFRNLMVAKITKADPRLIDLPSDICERLLQQSQNFSLEEIFSTFNLLVNTQDITKRLESLRIPLEISLVKLAYDKRGLSLNHPNVTAVDHERNNVMKPPLPKDGSKENKAVVGNIPTENLRPEPNNPVSLDTVREGWVNVINNLSRIKMSVATYLNEGRPLKLEKNILTISFPKDYSLHKESLETKENRAIIERIISELFNFNVRINFVLSNEAIQKEDNENNPFLKNAIEAFKGKMIY